MVVFAVLFLIVYSREIEDGCSSGLPARLAGRLGEHASVLGSHPLPALSLAFFEIV